MLLSSRAAARSGRGRRRLRRRRHQGKAVGSRRPRQSPSRIKENGGISLGGGNGCRCLPKNGSMKTPVTARLSRRNDVYGVF